MRMSSTEMFAHIHLNYCRMTYGIWKSGFSSTWHFDQFIHNNERKYEYMNMAEYNLLIKIESVFISKHIKKSQSETEKFAFIRQWIGVVWNWEFSHTEIWRHLVKSSQFYSIHLMKLFHRINACQRRAAKYHAKYCSTRRCSTLAKWSKSFANIIIAHLR